MAISIRKISVRRFPISLHCAFHRSVTELIGRHGAAALHMEDIIAEYKALVEDEQLISNRATTYLSTGDIKRADTLRDNVAGVIIQVVFRHQFNPLEHKAQAAKALHAALAPFLGLRRRQYASATIDVKSMIAVLRQEEHMARLRTLALTEELDELERRNNQVAEMVGRKSAENTARAPQTDTDTLRTRQRLDELYARCVSTAGAYAITTPTPALDEFIRSLNGQIATFRSLSAKGGGKRAAAPDKQAATAAAPAPTPEGEGAK